MFVKNAVGTASRNKTIHHDGHYASRSCCGEPNVPVRRSALSAIFSMTAKEK
jgi:hypothetical protein